MASDLEPSSSDRRETAPRSSWTRRDALGWLFCVAALVLPGYLIYLSRNVGEIEIADMLYPVLLFTALAGYGTRLLGLTTSVGLYWCLCGVLWFYFALEALPGVTYPSAFSTYSYWGRLAVFSAPFVVCSTAGSTILYLNKEKGWWWFIICLIPCGIVTIFSVSMESLVSNLSREYAVIAIYLPLLFLWYVAVRLLPLDDSHPALHKSALVIFEGFLAAFLLGMCVFFAREYATFAAGWHNGIPSPDASNVEPAVVALYKDLCRAGDSLLMMSLSHGIAFVLFLYLVVLLRLRANSGKKVIAPASGTEGDSSLGVSSPLK